VVNTVLTDLGPALKWRSKVETIELTTTSTG
jgi:hypothetical protein